jgi:BNR/Asp-box repeat
MIKQILMGLAMGSSLCAFAQSLQVTHILEDRISIRAISLDGDKLWYTGTGAQLGYVNLKNPQEQELIILGDSKLDFRAIGQNKDYVFAINTQAPCQMFQIEKKSLKGRILFSFDHKDAFFDAIAIKNNNEILALGDPEEQSPVLLYSEDAGENFKEIPSESLPKLKANEAHFAASNSNIFWQDQDIKIITGGAASQLMHSTDNGKTWQTNPLPIIQGSKTQGAYSQDYDGDFGIIVGGDYTQQSANLATIITSTDAGKTWQTQADGKNPGYRTCVKIRPGSKGKEIMAIGDANISYSKDFGKTWQVISNEKGLYTLQWLNANTLVAAGLNRMVKLSLVE